MGKRSKYWGLIIISGLLIGGSIYHLIGIGDFSFYKFMFQPLSEKYLIPRYILSIIFRVITLILGMGLMMRKEIFRKCVLGLCIFTLCIVPLKHPYYVFENIAIYNEYQVMDTQGHYPLTHKWIPYVSMGFYCLMDIIFSLTVFFYLRKKEVKLLFEK